MPGHRPDPRHDGCAAVREQEGRASKRITGPISRRSMAMAEATAGRVKSRAGDKRTRRFCIAISDSEWKLMRALAANAGMTRTDFILSCTVYADTLPVLPPQDELRALWRELVSQGTNLNQITAATNRLAKAADRGDVDPREIHDLVEAEGRLAAECHEEILEALRRVKDLLACGGISDRRV